ncbi:MAG: zinc metallopeptidase [Firmicutes bacterium]|nr:zinc metallopeptidase [Bacillota bacterium]MDH7495623.1 zinc metallopeptidase [Bacillota bacterium]
MFFWDPTYILIFPAILFAMWAQSRVHGVFNAYSRVRAHSGVSGAEVARRILDDSGLHSVRVEQIPGRLHDHYDPRTRVLRLSPEVYGGSSLAALGVAAHEAGHAIQHASGYVPLAIRSSLVPVATFGSNLAFPLFLIGFVFAGTGLEWLMTLGIWLFVGAVAFSVVTLPVEYDASRRALAYLERGGYVSRDELRHTGEVLSAAGLTYLAATAVAVTQLLRLLILRGSRRD